MKKMKIEYQKNHNVPWQMLKQNSSYVIIVSDGIDAIEFAKCELADQLYYTAHRMACKNASETRNYKLANEFPDWHEFYKEVGNYKWKCEEYQP